ncbi:MAG: ThuA domain-containing protein [Bacteroidota bacterium]
MSIKKSSKKIGLALLLAASVAGSFYACKPTPVISTQPIPPTVAKVPRILVFSKTKGWFHTSIPAGIAALQKLGKDQNIVVDTTKNAAYFVEDSLKNYSAVVFLNTTQNVLNPDQQVAFERYIQAGGGFVGIHSAADTEYNWPWYNRLVGAYFQNHPNNPNVRQATIDVVDKKNHPAAQGLPARWVRTDEWYNYKSIQPDLTILAKLDETSYEGGENGDNHPIAWYHEIDGGRAFYTGLGHTDETYQEPLFLQHLLGGIQYAIGTNKALEYSKAYAVQTPEENRFTKTILSNDLNEPMELAVAPDGRVFFVERAGKFYMYDPIAKKTKLVYDFPVKAVDKYLNGLLGMTLDPDFSQNNYIYFFNTAGTNEQLKQHISRFVISPEGVLDLESEKVIIEIPIEAEVSAHTGGSLAWDKDKNLYISTGDNTVPFESDGFAPIDTRTGRITFDASRSAGNPNDLRGKILRIHPQADGTYTVPEGNLFAKGTAGGSGRLTRPEIYIMGCRNPYRMSVDQATSIVYWGEIGPDSGTDGVQGPRGYDEFNQAKKPGNYGWPFFVGDNKPYHQYDFATKAVGELFDANAPINTSPNNSGAKTLPPAQKAMVWFPYNKSTEFPELGVGGRCAIGGPVYHFNSSTPVATRLPAYFDKALFVGDWMRNWVYVIRLDENQNYQRLEPFMPLSGDFKRPIDLEISDNGILYLLEYGSVYGIDNDDARLVRIDFNAGNRAPVAAISANETVGLAPLKVDFNSQKSYDADEEDKLTYEWKFEGNAATSTEANPSHTFQKNGIYQTILKVTDQAGKSDTDTLEIKVGNTLPQIAISTTSNSTFYFDNTPLKYAVDVKDKEDKTIDKKKVKVTLNYIPQLANSQTIGHQQITQSFNLGKSLMAGSDCKACHQLEKKSVGPAFKEVSKRYLNDNAALTRLANKVITGGGGVWGDHAMNAHPQLSKEEATEIVKYVLSLANQQPDVNLAQQGSIALKEHVGKEKQGSYVLTASYTDKGGAIAPLTNSEVLVLRSTKVQVEEADRFYNLDKQEFGVGSIRNKGYFVLKNIDLQGVSRITYRYTSKDNSATIEVHQDSPKGPVISLLPYAPTGNWDTKKELSTAIQAPVGKHDLYFVFVNNEGKKNNLGWIDWINFEK